MTPPTSCDTGEIDQRWKTIVVKKKGNRRPTDGARFFWFSESVKDESLGQTLAPGAKSDAASDASSLCPVSRGRSRRLRHTLSLMHVWILTRMMVRSRQT